jgi:large subunit ribosomal protein L35
LHPQTVQKPRVYATVFHPEPRLYTLLMVDPGRSRCQKD